MVLGELLKTLEYCLVLNKFLLSHFPLPLIHRKKCLQVCVMSSSFIENDSSHFKRIFAKQSLPNKFGLSPSIIHRVHFSDRFSYSIGFTACPCALIISPEYISPEVYITLTPFH